MDDMDRFNAHAAKAMAKLNNPDIERGIKYEICVNLLGFRECNDWLKEHGLFRAASKQKIGDQKIPSLKQRLAQWKVWNERYPNGCKMWEHLYVISPLLATRYRFAKHRFKRRFL